MTNHHPDTHWLAEYAAGSLGDSQALCVSTHLTYCPQCRQHAAGFTEVAATMFNNNQSDAGKPSTDLSAIMAQINENAATAGPDSNSDNQHQTAVQTSANDEQLPHAILKLLQPDLNSLRWKKIGSRISIARLQNLTDKRNISLHKLQPGGIVAEHDHHGREITVVLRGSFSDQDGQYYPGDFLVRDPGETHRPSVSSAEECLCLAVCDAPVKFTGFFTRLLNPLVSYKH